MAAGTGQRPRHLMADQRAPWTDDLSSDRCGALPFNFYRQLRTLPVESTPLPKAPEDHLAIHKLRTNEPLTSTDLAELQRMLMESGVGSGGCRESNQPKQLARPVCSIVGGFGPAGSEECFERISRSPEASAQPDAVSRRDREPPNGARLHECGAALRIALHRLQPPRGGRAILLKRGGGADFNFRRGAGAGYCLNELSRAVLSPLWPLLVKNYSPSQG